VAKDTAATAWIGVLCGKLAPQARGRLAPERLADREDQAARLHDCAWRVGTLLGALLGRWQGLSPASCQLPATGTACLPLLALSGAAGVQVVDGVDPGQPWGAQPVEGCAVYLRGHGARKQPRFLFQQRSSDLHLCPDTRSIRNLEIGRRPGH